MVMASLYVGDLVVQGPKGAGFGTGTGCMRIAYNDTG